MPGVALVALDFSGEELGRAGPTDASNAPGRAGPTDASNAPGRAGPTDASNPTGASNPADVSAPTDVSGREHAATELSAEQLWAAVPRGRTRAEVHVDGRTVTSAPVLVGDHLEAVVLAVGSAPLLEHEELLFEQGVAGVSLELARHRSVRDARRARVDELLEEVAAGRTTSALVERALRRLGVEALPRYRVLGCAVPGEGTATQQAMCALVEDAVVPHAPPIVGRLGGVVYAVVPDDEGIATQVLAAATARGWSGVTIGRSRAKTELDALRAALREATVALHLDDPEPIRDVDTLGLPGLLAGIRDELGAEGFVTQVLGPVLAYDRRESAQLTATLRAYLAHGCRPGPAAEELCIHRHTLAYRLDRVRDLTGRDPRSGEHLVTFGLALELLRREPA
jgi:PucR family transcriptional regulator, purine catabolism regulatory protein